MLLRGFESGFVRALPIVVWYTGEEARPDMSPPLTVYGGELPFIFTEQPTNAALRSNHSATCSGFMRVALLCAIHAFFYWTLLCIFYKCWWLHFILQWYFDNVELTKLDPCAADFFPVRILKALPSYFLQDGQPAGSRLQETDIKHLSKWD